MKAPGQDWGWMDAVGDSQKRVPRVHGICGRWTSQTNDDRLSLNGNSKVSASNYVGQYRVQGASLFDKTPASCETQPQPVPVVAKQCAVTPRPVQKPVIGVIDIEDITELLKNYIEGDDDDDKPVYVWDDEGDLQLPERSDEFKKQALEFCEFAMLSTKFAKECATVQVRVSGAVDPSNTTTIDLDQFVQGCYNDILFQSPRCESDECTDAEESERETAADMLASAQYEALEEFCLSAMARDPRYVRVCQEGDDCEMSGDICIGDCTIVPKDKLKNLVEDKCPNSCGANAKQEGAGGNCTFDEVTGKNKCVCFDAVSWGGEDCTVAISGVSGPVITRLSPPSCATQDLSTSDKKCPTTVEVHIDAGHSSFIKDQEIECVVNGKTSKAVFLSSEHVRCELDADSALSHTGSAEPLFHKVQVSMGGGSKSKAVNFCYHNSECIVCKADGTFTIKNDTCSIDDTCFQAGDKPESFGTCRECVPDFNQGDWKYSYEDSECGPTLLEKTYAISEMYPLNTEINSNNPVATSLNVLTRGDTVNLPKYQLKEASDIFQLDEDTGLITLLKPLNFEESKEHKLTVLVTQGGLTDEGMITINVFDVDEGPVFEQQTYTAVVEENADVTQVLANTKANDPDGDGTEFGTVKYSLSMENGKANPGFEVDEDTGVVTVTNPLNFEEESQWVLTVEAAAEAGSGSVGRAHVIVNVTDVNEPPIHVDFQGKDTILLRIPENVPVGDVVGTLVAEDEDADETHTFSISFPDGTPTWLAVDDATGELTMAESGLDYESEIKSILMTVTVTDKGGLEHSDLLELFVDDVNDPPTDVRVVEKLDRKQITFDGINGVAVNETFLKSIPEVTPVGVKLATLVVDDQDFSDLGKHTFAITDADSSPFRVVGDVLMLKSALDFEKSSEATLELVATDVLGLSTSPKTFTFAVVDGVDVPREFGLELFGKVNENTPEGTKIGELSAVDQDTGDDQKFTLGINGDALRVGETKCESTSTGMKCSAEVFVNGPIDFETNRKTVDSAELLVDAFATYTSPSPGGEATCGELCPTITIANVNDAPTDVLVEGSDNSANGGVILVETGAFELGDLVAVDPDDSCPSSVEGCDDTFTPSSEFTFELTGGSQATFKLSSSCSVAKTTAQRAGVDACVLSTFDGQPLAMGDSYSLVIKVTDNKGASGTFAKTVEVTSPGAPELKLFKHKDGVPVPLESLEERPLRLPGVSVLVGLVRLVNWVESEVPPMPRVVSGPVEVLPAGSTRQTRRRRSIAHHDWELHIQSTALSSDMSDVSFTLKVDGVTERSFTIPVTEYIPKNTGTYICRSNGDEQQQQPEDEDCDWARQNLLQTVSKGIVVDAFAEPAVIAELLFKDPTTNESVSPQPQWSMTAEPNRDLFDITPEGQIQILQKPSTIIRNGKMDVAENHNLFIVAKDQSGNEVLQSVEIRVMMDFCSSAPCDEEGTVTCSHTINRASSDVLYNCECKDHFAGETCATFIPPLDAQDPNNNNDALNLKTDGDDDNSMSAGAVAGLIIGVLLLLLIIVAVVLVVLTRRREEKENLQSLRSASMAMVSNPAHRRQSTTSMKIPFIRGQPNDEYPYYRPTMDKNAIYQELNSAPPGDFIVRDLAQSKAGYDTYEILVKTPKKSVSEHIIDENRDSVSVRGVDRSFPNIPMLVHHYASITDEPGQPFILALDNPGYLSVMGTDQHDIYNNEDISNLPAVPDAAAPALPTKTGAL